MSPIAELESKSGHKSKVFVESAKVNSPDGEFNDYDVFYRSPDPEIEADLTDLQILKIKRTKKENPQTLLLDGIPVKEVVFKKGFKVTPHFT